MWPFKNEKPTGMLPNPEQDQDPRNLAYDEIAPAFGAPTIPDEGSVIARPVQFMNQGRSHSCTCHSTSGAIHQTTGKHLSPRYAYWRIKTDKKYASSQISYGAYMKDSVSVYIKEGSCDYELLPNWGAVGSEEDYLYFVPTKEMRESAKKNAGGSYVYTTTTRGSKAIFDATIRYMWEQKRPVKVGVRWYKEYNKQRKGGIIPARMPDSMWYGHDMCAVAWKEIDGEPYIGFINSWGPNWGDKGMAWLPRNFAHFYSPIAVIPPIKERDLEIEKDVEVVIEERNLHKERANAQELTAMVKVKFPEVGDIEANANNIVARSLFGKKKIMFTKAVSYLGWDFTDVINYLYAHSRGKSKEDAYNLNFKILREDYFKK